MDYRIERISREKLTDLIPIFRNAFKRKISVQELINKYDTEFFGHSYIGYVAYSPENNEPAAYYGVFPMEIEIDGKRQLIVQSGDTMTDPRHQGKGLFVTLAKRTYALCSELGIQAVFGFPSDSSYPGFVKKLAWQHPENLENFTIWTYTLPVSALLRVKGLASVYKLWRTFVLSLYKKGTRFRSSVFQNFKQGMAREENFWNYKFRNSNNICIVIAGHEVILKTDLSLGIGDINVSNREAFEKTIQGIKWLAFLLGVPRISFYVSPGTTLSNWLKEKHVAKKGLAVGYVVFSGELDLSSQKYTYFDFDTF